MSYKKIPFEVDDPKLIEIIRLGDAIVLAFDGKYNLLQPGDRCTFTIGDIDYCICNYPKNLDGYETMDSNSQM